MDEYQWIEGAVAVESVLQSNSREVTAIYVRSDRYDTATARLQQSARALVVPVERVAGEVIAAHMPEGSTSGIIARVGPRRFSALDELIFGHAPVIVMLDGVEDPFNFGQAVRSLYAAGIDGLVVRPRNWLTAAATVIRASAGACEMMPTAAAETADVVAMFRGRGVPVAIATPNDARPMFDVDLTGPLLLIIGGEKRGVARSVVQLADVRVSIPYGRDFTLDLGTAGAAAALGFEILRQRLERQG